MGITWLQREGCASLRLIFGTKQGRMKYLANQEVICTSAVGEHRPFQCLMTSLLPDLHLNGHSQCFPFYTKKLINSLVSALDPNGHSQCFPFYTYTEDGQHRHENITGWALIYFCRHYRDATISQWDIFHYVYGLLHHPGFRRKYAANFRHELPCIPIAPDFWTFARAGQALAELHVNYKQQPAYPPQTQVTAQPLRWDVQKMKLNKEKAALIYNETLTLAGIPPEIFEYRLGNRSVLDWIIDQYQIKTDLRSSIVNDPNHLDEPRYIVEPIQKVIAVSIETMKIVKGLPELIQ